MIPNGLTVSRGLLTFAIIVLFSLPQNIDIPYRYWFILFLFLLAIISDYFDGYFARKWNVITDWGIVFDSLLDKVLIISMFFLLVPSGIFPSWLLLTLIIRDVLVDGIKNYSLKNGHAVPSIKTGKWKFVFQGLMIVFALLALAMPEQTGLEDAAYVIGFVALFFSIFSAILYMRDFVYSQRKK